MAYKPYLLKIHTDAMGSAVLLGGVLSQSIKNQTQVQADVISGSQYALHASINEIKSGFRFRTTSLKQAIDAIGLTGLTLLSTTNPGLELYQILFTDQGQIASGSVHRKIAIRNGRAVLRSLSCQHRQDAELEIEAMSISADGTASPITITESVALPGAVTDPARWTLGSAAAAGVDLGCILSVDIDFGIDVKSSGCQSNVFDTQIEQNSVLPIVRINTKKTNVFSDANIPLVGKESTIANSNIKLRKRVKNTGSFVAAGTAEHVLINFSGVTYCNDAFDAQGNQDGTTNVETTAITDGTNTPVTINTASAI